MATLDWSQCPAVESIPGKVSVAWVFKETRMPVATVFENLEAGLTAEEVMEEFDVSREQLNAVLEFVARSIMRYFQNQGKRNFSEGALRFADFPDKRRMMLIEPIGGCGSLSAKMNE
jgi:uncharacterized protein (DUF433 family)